MPRPATGQVVYDKRRKQPVYGLRFRAYGKRHYLTLGTKQEGWNHEKAEVELANIIADVRRGIWQPPAPEVPDEAPREIPTFHVFATEWFNRQKLEGGRRGNGLAPKSQSDLDWRLSVHLLPAFASRRLDQITVEDIDRYRSAKVAEARAIQKAAAEGKPILREHVNKHGRAFKRPAQALSATSINKTITTLSAILEAAVEYELIPRNPARGRRRRLPATSPPRSWLDRADHISALLDAATQLDVEARTQRGQRRALLATLIFAGLRISEALSLRWRDVDLARGTIAVRASKTDAGVRTVNILPVLRDELLDYRARGSGHATALVFGTATGAQHSQSNVRTRILKRAAKIANEGLAKHGTEPLPARLTPHSMRRTFASLLFARNEPPPYVMAQMGHTTPNLTLAIYARCMDRRDGEPARLKALIEGREWAALGSNGDISESETSGARTASGGKTAQRSG